MITLAKLKPCLDEFSISLNLKMRNRWCVIKRVCLLISFLSLLIRSEKNHHNLKNAVNDLKKPHSLNKGDSALLLNKLYNIIKIDFIILWKFMKDKGFRGRGTAFQKNFLNRGIKQFLIEFHVTLRVTEEWRLWLSFWVKLRKVIWTVQFNLVK